MTDKGESVLNGFSIEEIEVLSADIVIDVNQIPLLTANAEIVLKRRITRTLDRLEAALPKRLIPEFPQMEKTERHFKIGFNLAIAEVKSAISKIRGEV